MKVPMEKAVQVVGEYLLQELGKVSDPTRRFGYRFAVGAMMANPSSFRQKAHDLGVLDDQDMLDTTAVRSGLTGAFSGGSILQVLGLTFSQSDAEELIRRLESA